jgi:ABC-2 type transport system permease protein
MSALTVNWIGVQAIYRNEVGRFLRTAFQSILSPVLSTSLYFIVFGSAIGSRMQAVDGVPYGAFIIPGLMMLTLLTESVSNASFGIYMPKFTGAVYEVLSAPIDAVEIVLGYVGGAATKSVIIGFIILITARFFVDYHIQHVPLMLGFLMLTSVAFSLFGFVIGLWADSFEKLSAIPLLVLTPLTFLGGSFYSIHMLPPFWRDISLFNPVVYLVNGFRWAFFGRADVDVSLSLGMTFLFMLICFAAVVFVIRTGWRLKA